MAIQSRRQLLGIALAGCCAAAQVWPSGADAQQTGCGAAASASLLACHFEAKDDLFVARAICMDSPGEMLDECLGEARAEYEEATEECGALLGARTAVCEQTADAPHDPPFGEAEAASFVDPLEIGVTVEANPYFPLVQGNRWTYQGSFQEDGELVTETITVTVLDETKSINGITCVVVRDVVEEDGELIEDTDDWFAQDLAGNIWYCGEEVKDYEWFDGDEPALPELVSNDGSFKNGRDGDKGGILLPRNPIVGDVFRQELSVGNAEDVIEILQTDGDETVTAAACNAACLVTRDFTPLEPDAEENKYFAPGVGMILEVNVDTGDRVELIEFASAQQ